jgi:hypothetical protein
MAVDPAAPRLIKVLSSFWWLLIWVRSLFEAVLLGPRRLEQFGEALAAPAREFAHARDHIRPRYSLAAE